MNLLFVACTTYTRMKRNYFYPAIQYVHALYQSPLLSSLDKNTPLTVSGDGRCDSPGHCANYGTYTIILSGDSGNKTLDIQLVRCDEVKEFECYGQPTFSQPNQQLTFAIHPALRRGDAVWEHHLPKPLQLAERFRLYRFVDHCFFMHMDYKVR